MFADLHIHSCLSPCADNDMTPNNILAMAKIKGLEIISITDHNSCYNVKSFLELEDEYDIIIIPGIEITTKEEVHLLGYFDDYSNLKKVSELIMNSLPNKKNLPNFFGNQFIVDKDDNVLEELDYMLIGASNYSIYEVVNIIRNNNGVCVPAHVNRGNNGLIINQGFIDPNLNFRTIEVSKNLTIDNDELLNRHLLFSSDAHNLGAILERDFSLPKFIKNKNDFLKWIKS